MDIVELSLYEVSDGVEEHYAVARSPEEAIKTVADYMGGDVFLEEFGDDVIAEAVPLHKELTVWFEDAAVVEEEWEEERISEKNGVPSVTAKAEEWIRKVAEFRTVPAFICSTLY